VVPSAFWDQCAFSVGGVDFLWIDVALAAMARGQWPAFERRLAEGQACAARAAQEGGAISQADVDEAATAFRYERDLIAGADVTAWLDKTGLTVEDWTGHLERAVLRERWADQLEDILDRFAPSARQLIAIAVAEGICTGTFDQLQRAFAGRAAFVRAVDEPRFDRACGRECEAGPGDRSAERLVQTHAHWLERRPAEDTAARLSTVLRIEAAFDALVDSVVTAPGLQDVIEAKRLDWIRCELETISFSTADAAREAVLCLLEDGFSLYDVAMLSRRGVERTAVMLEEVDAQFRDRLMASKSGDVLGPLAVDGHFEVTRLVTRASPTLADPRVAARARQTIVDRAIQHAMREHVSQRAET
jgi:hypothetical protein